MYRHCFKKISFVIRDRAKWISGYIWFLLAATVLLWVWTARRAFIQSTWALERMLSNERTNRHSKRFSIIKHQNKNTALYVIHTFNSVAWILKKQLPIVGIQHTWPISWRSAWSAHRRIISRAQVISKWKCGKVYVSKKKLLMIYVCESVYSFRIKAIRNGSWWGTLPHNHWLVLTIVV